VSIDNNMYQPIEFLPMSMGLLKNLAYLNLTCTGIRVLPPTIGQLRNLEDLILKNTINLEDLPEEIGDLVNLKTLNLRHSRITSLPASIGRLRNLKDRNLSAIKYLEALPEEIGELTSLLKLNLRESGIASLPASIGRLRNLKILDHQDTHLTALSEVFGDLTSLVQLNSSRSSPYDHYDNDDDDGSLSPSITNKLGFALACGRARSRTGFGIVDDTHSIQRIITPKLWPLVLSNATRAFMIHNPKRRTGAYYCRDYRIQTPDAIRQLRIDGRGSFLGPFVDRNTKEVPKT